MFAGVLELAWCGEGRFMNLTKLCLDTGSYESAVPRSEVTSTEHATYSYVST